MQTNFAHESTGLGNLTKHHSIPIATERVCKIPGNFLQHPRTEVSTCVVTTSLHVASMKLSR